MLFTQENEHLNFLNVKSKNDIENYKNKLVNIFKTMNFLHFYSNQQTSVENDILKMEIQDILILLKSFNCWKFFVISLILNLICSVFSYDYNFFLEQPDYGIFIALIYTLAFPFILFDFICISTYQMISIQKEKTIITLMKQKTLFIIFFVMMLSFFLACGIKDTGSCGVIRAINLLLNNSLFTFSLSLSVTVLFLVSFIQCFGLLIQVFYIDDN